MKDIFDVVLVHHYAQPNTDNVDRTYIVHHIDGVLTISQIDVILSINWLNYKKDVIIDLPELSHNETIQDVNVPPYWELEVVWFKNGELLAATNKFNHDGYFVKYQDDITDIQASTRHTDKMIDNIIGEDLL